MFNNPAAYRLHQHWKEYRHSLEKEGSDTDVNIQFLWHDYGDKISSAWGDLGMATLSERVWDTLAAFNRIWNVRRDALLVPGGPILTTQGKRRRRQRSDTIRPNTRGTDELIDALSEEIGDWTKHHRIARECRAFGIGILFITGSIMNGTALRYDGHEAQYSIQGRRKAIWCKHPSLAEKHKLKSEFRAWLRPRMELATQHAIESVSREIFAIILHLSRGLYPSFPRRGERIGIRICKKLRHSYRMVVAGATFSQRMKRLRRLDGASSKETKHAPWLYTRGDRVRVTV